MVILREYTGKKQIPTAIKPFWRKQAGLQMSEISLPSMFTPDCEAELVSEMKSHAVVTCQRKESGQFINFSCFPVPGRRYIETKNVIDAWPTYLEKVPVAEPKECNADILKETK